MSALLFLVGVILILVGLVCIIRPIAKLKIPTRKRALLVLLVGLVIGIAGGTLGADDRLEAAKKAGYDSIEAHQAAIEAREAGYATVEEHQAALKAEAAEAEARKEKEAEAERALVACRKDYTQCRTQEELYNNFDLIPARVACKSEAKGRANYGDPDFPGSSFVDGYFPSQNTAKTGVITLVENEARFQNAFGAMRRVSIKCTYDLKAEKLLYLNIE